jgi:integrase/recombinase XerD
MGVGKGTGGKGGRIGKPKLPPNAYWRGNTIWGRIEVAGSVHRCSLRTSDPKEAKAHIDAWRKRLNAAAVGNPECPTFKVAVVRWATEVLPQSVKPSVAQRYLVSMGQLEPVMGNLKVDHITTAKISEYISIRSKSASNATIRRDVTALSRLLSSCIAWGWRQGNPARDYDRSVVRERRAPIQPPDPGDVAKFIAAAPAGLAAALRLLAETGMRENEAANLEWRDVDQSRRTITLVRTKTNRPRTIAWKTPGGDATNMLTGGSGGYLFVSEQGKPYKNFSSNAFQVMRRLIAAEQAAGRDFRRFRVHDLRHAFAVNWLKAGGDIYRLSRHLGHSSVKTTEIYLGYLSVEEQDRVHRSSVETRM